MDVDTKIAGQQKAFDTRHEGVATGDIAHADARLAEDCSWSGVGTDVECSTVAASKVPLFITPRRAFGSVDDVAGWVSEHRQALDKLILRHGGIVLRGFPIRSAEDFDQLMGLFPAYDKGYVGGASPRGKVVGRVLEATKLGEDINIPLHQETSYLRTYPPRIAFFCKQPAEVGGATTIASMRSVTQGLPQWLERELEQHGVRGVLNFAAPGGARGDAIDSADSKPWPEVYGTSSRDEVESLCEGMGQQTIWNDDGSLTVVTVMPAFTTHPVTGERFYRANLHTHYLTYERHPRGDERRNAMLSANKLPTGYAIGNGRELTRDESRQLESLFDAAVMGWKWQAGDLMILDNLQVAHGRAPYKGHRETLVALLGEPQAA